MTERNIKDDPRPGDRARITSIWAGAPMVVVHVLAVTPTSVFYAEGFVGQKTQKCWLSRADWRTWAEPCD